MSRPSCGAGSDRPSISAEAERHGRLMLCINFGTMSVTPTRQPDSLPGLGSPERLVPKQLRTGHGPASLFYFRRQNPCVCGVNGESENNPELAEGSRPLHQYVIARRARASRGNLDVFSKPTRGSLDCVPLSRTARGMTLRVRLPRPDDLSGLTMTEGDPAPVPLADGAGLILVPARTRLQFVLADKY